MSVQTLEAIRERIESLTVEDGEFYVVCGRTGERPFPIEEKRFLDRETAVEAAQTATAYRAVLREYDPRTPVYDFVVCQGECRGSAGTAAVEAEAEQATAREGDV